jgi:hypothetical protein
MMALISTCKVNGIPGIDKIDLKPMSTAPRKSGVRVLVLDEWSECGQICRGYKFVYWLRSFDNMPNGWYGQHCGDLRNPQGWVLSI